MAWRVKNPRQPRTKKDEAKSGRKARSALSDVVTREYTIILHKRVHDMGFKHVRRRSSRGRRTDGRSARRERSRS